jgi:hypothetical protein
MCYSAPASFTAVIALSIIGYKTISRVKKREEFFVNSIPLLFAIQQASEGILWLSIGSERYSFLTTPATYIFLSFAFLCWPWWIPYSLLLLEEDENKEVMLGWALGIGIAIALLIAIYLILYGAHPYCIDNSIAYDIQLPKELALAGTVGYLLATVGAFFLSTIPYMWIMGIATGIAYLISYFFYYQCHVSIWCFYAAALSMLIVIIKPEKK